MTIKGLSAFIKKMFPHARRLVPVQYFHHKRVCIDGHLLSYAYLSTAIGKEAKKLLHSRKMEIDPKIVTTLMLERWLSTIALLKEAKLIPIVVFDGSDVPPEKTATRAKRMKGKENFRKEIESLRSELQTEDLELNMEARNRLVKLLPRDVHVTSEHIHTLRHILTLAGVSVLQASGEGEALCASLVKEGHCYATYTSDSDMGAYLSPRVILEVGNASYTPNGAKVQHCTVIYYKSVMKVLKLSEKQFVDLCIMCGTDYNDNVPGRGPGKAYKLLQEFGILEAIPSDHYDKSVLNYFRVREIFSTPTTPINGDVVGSPEPKPTELSRLLATSGLLKSGGRLLAMIGSNEPRVSVSSYYDDAELL